MGIYASVQNPSETLPCKLCHLLRNVRSGWVDAAGCRRGKKPGISFPSLTGIPYKTLGHDHEAICI